MTEGKVSHDFVRCAGVEVAVLREENESRVGNPYQLAWHIWLRFQEAGFAPPIVTLASFDDGMKFYTEVRRRAPSGMDYRDLTASARWESDGSGYAFIQVQGVEFRWPLPRAVRPR